MSDADIYRRIPEEIFNQGKIELIDEFFPADYIEHVPSPPGMPSGREGLRLFAQGIRAAFPDFHLEVISQYQDGDTHIAHVRGSGTMKGDFAGMPASGKSATWEEIHIGRMQGGKVVEHWGVMDQLGMLQQLGFIPEPGA